MEALDDELRKLNAQDVIVSCNLDLTVAGIPRSRQKDIADQAVAVYWKDGDRPKAMACDLYPTVADNIRAITHCIAALRALDRHGGGTIMAKAFEGFAELPCHDGWRTVLGVGPDAGLDSVRKAYHELAKASHPDVGGSDEAMARVNAAYAAAKAELECKGALF